MHIYMYTFIYECMDSLYVNAYIYIYMYGPSICIVYVYIIESLIVPWALHQVSHFMYTTTLLCMYYYHPCNIDEEVEALEI